MCVERDVAPSLAAFQLSGALQKQLLRVLCRLGLRAGAVGRPEQLACGPSRLARGQNERPNAEHGNAHSKNGQHVPVSQCAESSLKVNRNRNSRVSLRFLSDYGVALLQVESGRKASIFGASRPVSGPRSFSNTVSS